VLQKTKAPSLLALLAEKPGILYNEAYEMNLIALSIGVLIENR
jgi:hypothetical protein